MDNKFVGSVSYKNYIDGHKMTCTFRLGDDNIKEIKEHAAQGEGDKWYYDVYFRDGTMTRLFNFDEVTYAELK